MAFLYALPGAVAEGLIWGLMAIGVYISYKILDIADLTVDGSICTGACVCAVLLGLGVPAWISVLVALLAGAVTGVVTGLLHTVLGIPSILAGILTQLMLYSVNLLILSGKSLMSIDPRANNLLVHVSRNNASIVSMVIIVAAVIFILYEFFYTEIGLTLKSTGDNLDMSRAQGVDVNRNKVIGLAIANGIVALAGALLAQYKGSANINDGRGAIVIGLAAIIIGEVVFSKIFVNFGLKLLAVSIGAVIYYMVVQFVVSVLAINTNYLKLFSALIVAVFLAVPYWKQEYFHQKRKEGHYA